MDVSRTQIYDIKNGKIPVSRKMMDKLEAAEMAAGVVAVPPVVSNYVATQDRIAAGEDVSQEEREAASAEGRQVAQWLAGLQALHHEIAAMRRDLDSRLNAIEKKLGK